MMTSMLEKLNINTTFPSSNEIIDSGFDLTYETTACSKNSSTPSIIENQNSSKSTAEVLEAGAQNVQNQKIVKKFKSKFQQPTTNANLRSSEEWRL
jgi:hypothetical protein